MNHNKIIQQVAKDLQKDPEVVERVCKTVFEFLTEVMREGKLEPYRIQGLGKFEVKPYIRQKHETRKKQREEREKKNRELYDSIGSGSSSEQDGCENGGVDSKEQKDIVL